MYIATGESQSSMGRYTGVWSGGSTKKQPSWQLYNLDPYHEGEDLEHNGED